VTQASTDVTEVWSVKRVLSWAADDLRRRGNESARLDAELLLSQVLKLDRIGLILQAERPLAAQELAGFRELFKRRRAGEPVAYLLGEREFYGIPLRVDRRVLIPRPDSETLVETALQRTMQRSMLGTALDLCTGSGCVAIAFARTRPTWQVTASDISAEALSVATENAHRTGAIRNLRLLQGAMFGAVAGERFNLITANPPYIPSGELASLPVDVRDFEPRLALDGGTDGLQLLEQIVREAPSHLEAGGILALEHSADQGPAVVRLLERQGYRDIELRRDLGGRDRVVSGLCPE
jgi:release factor glutamine methyltransferase